MLRLTWLSGGWFVVTDMTKRWVVCCDRPPQHPQTPEERIMWQEQIRMIHLRSHLNQLAEKVKHANYIVDKTRWDN